MGFAILVEQEDVASVDRLKSHVRDCEFQYTILLINIQIVNAYTLCMHSVLKRYNLMFRTNSTRFKILISVISFLILNQFLVVCPISIVHL